MKKSKHALVALLAVLAAGTASAQSMNKDSGYYGEIGYTTLSAKNSTNGFDATPKLARFIVGKDINANLSVEGMYATTVSKGNSNGFEISLEETYGIFLKPKMEVAKDTEVFARVGWTESNIKQTWSGGSNSSNESDVGYGLGIQTKFTKDVYGQIDYMNYYDKNSQTLKGFTVSIGARF